MTSIVASSHALAQLALPLDDPAGQRCRLCGECKPLQDFSRGKHGAYITLCKACRNRQARERRGAFRSNTKLDRSPTPICRRCGLAKPFAQFPKRSNRSSGRHGVCRDCHNHLKREAYARLKAQSGTTWNETPQARLSKQLDKLRARYGVTLEQIRLIYQQQEGRCAVCERALEAPPAKNTQVDHDHETGLVRGLLCFNCNMGLGYFKDNATFLARAVAYLRSG